MCFFFRFKIACVGFDFLGPVLYIQSRLLFSPCHGAKHNVVMGTGVERDEEEGAAHRIDQVGSPPFMI